MGTEWVQTILYDNNCMTQFITNNALKGRVVFATSHDN